MPCPTIQEGSDARYAMVIQDACDVIPTDPAWIEIKRLSSPVETNKDTLQDDSLGDIEMTDVTTGSINVTTTIAVNMRPDNYDKLIEAAMMNEWSPVATVTSTSISVDDTDNSFNGVGLFTGFSNGDKIDVTGFTEIENNGTFTIVTATDDKLIVQEDVLITEAAGDSVTIETDADYIEVGNTKKYIALEIYYPTLGKYRRIVNLEVASMGFEESVNSIITGSFSLTGGKELDTDTAELAGATYTNYNTARAYSSSNGSMTVDDVDLGIVTDLSPTMEKNSTELYAIGNKYPIGVSHGKRAIEFDATIYFNDFSYIDKAKSESDIDLEIKFKAAGATDYHKIIYPRTRVLNVGLNDQQTELLQTVSLMALKDTTTSMRIVRGS
jgi:hypothetical protein